ncbi:hypothetical protein ACFQ0M_05960 [Kitasatospora aburaviensis]
MSRPDGPEGHAGRPRDRTDDGLRPAAPDLVDPVVARAAGLLSGLPLGRACGLDPDLARDAALLAAGTVPRLRIAVAGPAAGPVRAWLEGELTTPDAPGGTPANHDPDATNGTDHPDATGGPSVPDCSADPAGSHLLLFAVADRSGPPDGPERRAAEPATAALARPGRRGR